MSEKIELTISQILKHLDEGTDRKQIQEIYGLSFVEMKEIFQHPKLKGKKVKKRSDRVILIDDVDNIDTFDNISNSELPIESNEIIEEEAPEQEVNSSVFNEINLSTENNEMVEKEISSPSIW